MTDRCALFLNGKAQNQIDRPIQPAYVTFGQRADAPFRMEAGGKIHLVRINIAESGDDSLVKEDVFDAGELTPADCLPERTKSEFRAQRLGAEFQAGKISWQTIGPHEPEVAELPKVVEEQLTSVAQAQDRARELIRQAVSPVRDRMAADAQSAFGFPVDELAGHFQMNDQSPAGLEGKQQQLCPPVQLSKDVSAQS